MSYHDEFLQGIFSLCCCCYGIWLFVIQWTSACQGLLSMGFPSQEYWGGLSSPSPRDLPDPGIEPMSPSQEENSVLTLSHLGNPVYTLYFALTNGACSQSKEIVEKVRKRKWGDTSLALMTLRLFHANLTPCFLSGSYYHSGFEATARWSQTEQLEFVPCGQFCQSTDVKEKLSPAQIKR